MAGYRKLSGLWFRPRTPHRRGAWAGQSSRTGRKSRFRRLRAQGLQRRPVGSNMGACPARMPLGPHPLGMVGVAWLAASAFRSAGVESRSEAPLRSVSRRRCLLGEQRQMTPKVRLHGLPTPGVIGPRIGPSSMKPCTSRTRVPSVQSVRPSRRISCPRSTRPDHPRKRQYSRKVVASSSSSVDPRANHHRHPKRPPPHLRSGRTCLIHQYLDSIIVAVSIVRPWCLCMPYR